MLNYGEATGAPTETWCQKLAEMVEVTLVRNGTTWKIWSSVSKERQKFKFTFLVKQVAGPRKKALITFQTKSGQIAYKRFMFSNFSQIEEYSLISVQDSDNQFVISCDISTSDPLTSKSSGNLSSHDLLISVGDKRFAVDESLSKKIAIKAGFATNRKEVKLTGVDYDDVITMIDNPDMVDVDITIEKCQKFAEIERRFGIRCQSEKVREILDQHFWSNTDKMDDNMMYNEVAPSVPESDIRISKKMRVPSLPNKFTITDLDLNFDIYLYIQEYNGTSYLSIGVITDKSTDNEYWSSLISLNIQLHHPQNPELDQSADISRELKFCSRELKNAVSNKLNFRMVL